MANEYTPEMKKIRADYITLHTRNFDEYTVGRSLTSEQEFYGDRFDDALAAHDRTAEKRGAIKALRSMARVVRDESEEGFIHVPTVGVFAVDEYLTRTADQIEGGRA